jgi:ABC-type transport system substrate-binding protein
VSTPTFGGGYSAAFNMTKAPLDDLRVRQAISLVISSKETVQRTGDGDSASVITTLDDKNSPFYNPKLKLPKSDPVQAQKLLDSYIAEHGGKPLEVTYLALNTPPTVRMAQAFQAIVTSRLKNIKVNIDVQTNAAGVARAASGDYQVTGTSNIRWVDPSIDDPANFSSTSSLNLMRYKNPAVDAALQQLAVTADIKTKKQLHDTVMQNVLKDVPVVFLKRFQYYYAVDKNLKGWQMFYDLRPFFEDVWLSKTAG